MGPILRGPRLCGLVCPLIECGLTLGRPFSAQAHSGSPVLPSLLGHLGVSLSAVYVFIFPTKLSIIVLNVAMLSIIIRSVIMPSFYMLGVIMRV
jgi:hypothetical protein